MALESASLLKAGLVLLMAVQVLPAVSGCNRGFYERVINDFCLAKFKFDMGGLDRGLWCSWPDTTEIYEGLTNCTYQVALRMDCFWPNQIVDHFFMHIHRIYFHNCALTGRLLHDPPIRILAPFIAVPVLITLLMTALVVWRSKRTEGFYRNFWVQQLGDTNGLWISVLCVVVCIYTHCLEIVLVLC